MSGTNNTVDLGGALMLAMTDLFVSATATLLVVLTLASSDPPTPLPVQADIVMLCPRTDAGTAEFALFPANAVIFREKEGILRPGTNFQIVRDHNELVKTLSAMELPAKPLLTVAIAPATGRPLTTNCFATVSRRLLSRYHYQSNDPRKVSVPTLCLQVINRPIRQNAHHE